jgi:hypothetical protein
VPAPVPTSPANNDFKPGFADHADKDFSAVIEMIRKG